MKITINKDDILDVLSKVQGLAGRKSNLAITENVLLRTIDSGLSLMATDLETGFEGYYPVIIELEGMIAINARKFFEIVRDFPSDDILLNEAENHWVEIGNSNVEYHIVSSDPDDFPDMPRFEDVDFIEIDSLVLKKMIDRTVMISPSSDDKRTPLLGVYMEKIESDDSKIIRMISTDGNRLSKVEHVLGGEARLYEGSNILIPKKGLNEVSKFLNTDGMVRIGVTNDKFVVKKENETISIRLLEGEFPDCSEIIAAREDHEIRIDKKSFLMMLKRMSILSTDHYKAVIFNFDDNRLLVTVSNPDIGQSKEDMVIQFNGDPIEVAFNPRYFIDALNAIEDDIIFINIKDNESPCFLQGEKDKTFLSVIMPMRI